MPFVPIAARESIEVHLYGTFAIDVLGGFVAVNLDVLPEDKPTMFGVTDGRNVASGVPVYPDVFQA